MKPDKIWNYFITIEQDLQKTSRFVEPDKDNWETYSIQFEHIIQLSCSEIDSIFKLICKEKRENLSRYNINKYSEIIPCYFPKFYKLSISARRWDLEDYPPWEEWKDDGTPEWWSAYNEIKHNRGENFRKANLENALKATAGLFGVVLYYLDFKERQFIKPFPNIFNHNHISDRFNSSDMGFNIKTPDRITEKKNQQKLEDS